jgi:hypothetical protein
MIGTEAHAAVTLCLTLISVMMLPLSGYLCFPMHWCFMGDLLESYNCGLVRQSTGEQMKFTVREANIDPSLRNTFERYGVVGVQVVLGGSNYLAKFRTGFIVAYGTI